MEDTGKPAIREILPRYKAVIESGLMRFNESSQREFQHPIIVSMLNHYPQLAERVLEQLKEKICPDINLTVSNLGHVTRLRHKDFEAQRDAMLKYSGQASHYNGKGELVAVTRSGVQSVHVETSNGEQYSVSHRSISDGSITVRGLVNPTQP